MDHKTSPAEEPFIKHPGSNPKEVRRQFLEHAMKQSHLSSSNPRSTGKLKPAKEILKRLKFDASYDTQDYMVGWIDRKAGILEKPVDAWGEYDEEELIAYIKNVNVGKIVWDKANKVDLVSGAKDR